MPRVKGGTVTRRRRKKVLKLAKGYYGSKHTLYKTAHEQMLKSLTYAYRDRKTTKRNFRKLWITRINAAARLEGLSYSQFMHGLKLANVDVNRKMLADLAVHDLNGFNQLVSVAKDALANPAVKEVKETVVEEKPVVKKLSQAKRTKLAAEAKAEEAPVVKEEKPAAKKEEKPVVKEEKSVQKEETKTEKAPEAKKQSKLTAIERKAVEIDDHSKLTVAELREFAKVREISIPAGSLKADIVQLLADEVKNLKANN